MSNRITGLSAFDVRFPTSESLDGADALNKNPDYSAAYLIIESENGDKGYGLIFTIGRGNDICCMAVESMRHLVVGYDLDDIISNMGEFYEQLRSDSQIRWLGPDTGVIHMARGGIANAVWDMWARSKGKPLWQLIADMEPEQFIECVDFRYLEDVITRDEALGIVAASVPGRTKKLGFLMKHGYPAYTTSAGWLGYSDEKLRRLCAQAMDEGFKHIKLKVGESLQDDIRRCKIAREVIGNDAKLMVDANQVWEVDQAIEWMKHLAQFDPWFIEEPTSPDDILGHKRIRDSLNGIQIASGEHCQNRIQFKQFISNNAIDIIQVDACRLAGLNEILAVYLMAAKYGKPVCPHAGGVGLCEYVQHLSVIDYLMISGEIGPRVAEYVDHLHEHFEAPCQVSGGAYRLPEAPGFGVKMLEDSVSRYLFPGGAEWQKRTAANEHTPSG